jgi:hypothetical protein
MNVSDIAAKCGGAKKVGDRHYLALCPAHNDGRPSLDIIEKGGKALFTCRAGCPKDKVTAALQAIGAWPSRERFKPSQAVVAKYDYCDEVGKLLFQVCRLSPKDFRQRRPDGAGGWIWNTEGVRKVPYRLPELLAAKAGANAHPPRVYIVEGEKDADRLIDKWILAATTNPGGAGKWRGDYNDHFAGFDVVIIPDNDEPGRKHAQDVGTNLYGVAASVSILDLPGLPPKGDVSDWLDLHPEATSQSDLERYAKPFNPSGDPKLSVGTLLFKQGSKCMPRKIDWVWNGYLPKGKVVILAGIKTAGKSTITIDFMATVTSGGSWPDGTQAEPGDVIVWSAEDDFEDTILPRFLSAGGDHDRIYFIEGVLDERGEKRPFDPSVNMPALQEAAAKLPNLKLAVIDPVVLVLPTRSDSHKNTETRRGLQVLVDFAAEFNIPVIGITHFTKGSDDKIPVERITGSLAFAAVPRVILAVAADEKGGERRLIRVASNIGPDGGGYEFSLIQATVPDRDFLAQRVDWGKRLTGSARELLNATKRPAEADAETFLNLFLENGPQPQKEIKAAADAHCHSWATIRRAKQKLGVKPYQNGRAWIWELPQRTTRQHAHD